MGRGRLVHLLERLRIIATTAVAFATGLINLATHRGEEHRVALAPGDEAPDFELTASDARTYRLSSFRGHSAVVIAWFPKAFTGGCTAECESIGTSGRALRQFNVAYFGASVDRPEINRQFAQSMGIDFPILSDPGKSVARAYGVLGPSGFRARRAHSGDRQARAHRHARIGY
jgi:peroxiredoxin Q/BCP